MNDVFSFFAMRITRITYST